MGFAILNGVGGVKNKEKVSKNELEKIKNHCIIGEKTIKKLPIFKDYENMILYYHEKNDGSGYPYGFKKE